jgi:CBS-domain-containing membrane protein
VSAIESPIDKPFPAPYLLFPGSHAQVSIAPDVSAIEAMLLMNEHQIGAVAVVDGVGKIIGNFSVSEMR